MSLKDFDAKQFMLEKGEQVGLGIALTLMVVMLVVSLFLPSRGFMSGSPEAKAQPLVDGSKTLETALRSRELPEQERPPKAEDRLINLDTNSLRLNLYATEPWFEPTAPENPARQPPPILTLAEARAEFAFVPIDTSIFAKKFGRLLFFAAAKTKKNVAPNTPAGRANPLARQYKGAGAMLPGGPGGKAADRFGNAAQVQGLQNILAADEKREYEPKLVSLESLTGSEHLARQLQPARMVLIEGSFPYKEQLEEFRRMLRLDTIQDVLDETVDKDKDEKEKLYAFRFLGVDVERVEVDGNNKPLGNWTKL